MEMTATLIMQVATIFVLVAMGAAFLGSILLLFNDRRDNQHLRNAEYQLQDQQQGPAVNVAHI